jgi:hypothetical protein
MEQPTDSQLAISRKSTTEEVTTDLDAPEVPHPIEEGPYGAMVLAGIAVALLFLGWLLFYFVLFMRRGYIG